MVAAAADVASFLEMYRFDFDAVRRWQDWADPYHQQSSWSLHAGVRALPRRHRRKRGARRRRSRALVPRGAAGGETVRRYPFSSARLACALLGELLYERGEVDEADRLLDESYQLGAEGGVVEMMICPLRHRCAHQGAARRPRCRRATPERRCTGRGKPWPSAAARPHRERADAAGAAGRRASPGRLEHEDARPDGGLGEITAQLRDETEIRGLLADQPGLACDRAHAWVHRLQPQARPRALLQANRLLVAALSAAGRTDEAKQTLAHIAAQCAERGMLRYLLDGGPRVVALLARSFATTCVPVDGIRRRRGLLQPFSTVSWQLASDLNSLSTDFQRRFATVFMPNHRLKGFSCTPFPPTSPGCCSTTQAPNAPTAHDVDGPTCSLAAVRPAPGTSVTSANRGSRRFP